MWQVSQCVDELGEEVVCVDNESILAIEEIFRLVQPQELPDNLVEMECFTRDLVD